MLENLIGQGFLISSGIAQTTMPPEIRRKTTHLACLVTAITGVAAMALPRIPAADTWWHLAAGRYLLMSGRISGADPFSFGTGRGDWLNHEWLAELLFYQVYQVLGLDGLFLFRTLVVVMAFAVLPLWSARRSQASMPWACAMVLGCAAAAEGWAFFDARAYLITYIGLAGTLFLANETLRTGDWRFLLPVPVGTALWANCHGGFILGPTVLLLVALGCLFPTRSTRLARVMTLVAIGTLALCAIATPFGLGILAFPFSLIGPSAFTVGLNEWAQPDLLQQIPFLVLLLVSAALAPRMDWPRRLSLFCFLGAGLLAWRHAPLAALMAAFTLPSAMPRGEAWYARTFRLTLLFWLLAALVMSWLVSLRVKGGAAEWTMLRTHFPVAAVRFLQANPQLPGNMVNPYEWGGYLEWTAWPQYRVFIDGRAHTVYSQQRYAEALAVQFGQPWVRCLERAGFGDLLGGRGHWEDILDRHGVRLVLCTRLQGDLVDRMSRSDRWFEVYRDPLAVIFLRSEPELVRLAQDLVHPVSQWTLFEEAQLRLREGREPEALESVSKALALDPRWPQALVFRGTLHLRAGRHAEGERDLREALAWDSRVPDAHFNLAVLAWTRGERELALKELRRELALNSGHTPARALLKEIQGR